MAVKKEKEEKGLAVQNGTAIPALADIEGMEGLLGAGFDGLDQSDLAISVPFISLTQPTSKIVAESRGKIPAGTFLFKKDDELVTYGEEIPIVILYIGKYRTMWSENFKRGDSPICRSLDAKTMLDGGAGDHNCEKCRYAKFDPATKTSKCNVSYVMLCQNLETKELFRLQVGGYSFKEGKEFIRKLRNAAMKVGGSTFSFQTKLSSEFVTNEKGSFYKVALDSDQGLKANSLLYVPIDDEHPVGIDMDYLNEVKETYQMYTDSLKGFSESGKLDDVSSYDTDFANDVDDEDEPF